jgi:sugar lactone lactonase YvrE
MKKNWPAPRAQHGGIAAFAAAAALLIGIGLMACAADPVPRPAGWAAPEVVVPPSSFGGVHGLAIDSQGRLLAGSVVASSIWEVDRASGAAKIVVPAPEGQADDIAIGPHGEWAWTSYLMGMLRYRASDGAPIRVLARDLPGLNSLDFDRKSGKLYASQVFLGDALWEIDVRGEQPPRLIAKDLGGFNGFEVGPDGMLYGPLWFKGSVVRIDPATGAVTVINSQFKTPAAANLDGKGGLWVIDTATGELARVDLASGAKKVERQLKPSLDNLAVAPDGTVYISNMADNSIEAYYPPAGLLRTLTTGALAVPAGLKVDGNALWVADIFTLRHVDLAGGRISDIKRMHAAGSDIEYPFAVGLSQRRLVLASWFTGWVQVMDRGTRQTLASLHGWKAPSAAIPLPDDSIVVAEMATGTLTQASGADFSNRRTIATDLAGPVAMIQGRDGALYVTEAAGRLVRIELAGGRRTIAEGLARPEGLAETPWGSLVVAEAGAARLVEVDPTSGERRTVAEKLPIGLAGGPGMPPPYVITGVDVAADGSIFFSADLDNALYRVRPRR